MYSNITHPALITEQNTKAKLCPHIFEIAIGEVGIKVWNEPIPDRFTKALASAKQNAHQITIHGPICSDKEQQQYWMFKEIR